jgi:hypothetical protein
VRGGAAARSRPGGVLERTFASYGSLIPGTGEVNHQWSKGWSSSAISPPTCARTSPPTCSYYSLLRPFSELAVARQFARLDRYDAHFSSCNRNFHLLGERPAQRWCGECPKCRFVFLALAPFMPKPRLMGIFGRNLLDEPEQAPGFDALLEYGDHKPSSAWARAGSRARAGLAGEHAHLARGRAGGAFRRGNRAAAHGKRVATGAAARSIG